MLRSKKFQQQDLIPESGISGRRSSIQLYYFNPTISIYSSKCNLNHFAGSMGFEQSGRHAMGLAEDIQRELFVETRGYRLPWRGHLIIIPLWGRLGQEKRSILFYYYNYWQLFSNIDLVLDCPLSSMDNRVFIIIYWKFTLRRHSFTWMDLGSSVSCNRHSVMSPPTSQSC